jgi:hypothetical protein
MDQDMKEDTLVFVLDYYWTFLGSCASLLWYLQQYSNINYQKITFWLSSWRWFMCLSNRRHRPTKSVNFIGSYCKNNSNVIINTVKSINSGTSQLQFLFYKFYYNAVMRVNDNFLGKFIYSKRLIFQPRRRKVELLG